MIKLNLVNNEEFVREPVDKETKEILNSSSNKIILTGGRGIGKSTVLYSLEKRGLSNNEQTIYTHPDAVMLFTKEPNEIINSKIFDYISELRFTNSILLYIKRNYPIVFRKYFEEDMEYINSLFSKLDNEINNSFYEGTNVECKYGIKELSYDIINKLKQTMEIDKLNIAIDRFDEMNGSSKYVQETYEKYFELFNKVILTSDDPNLDNKRLSDNGYEVRNISYGNDKDVLREIIRYRKSLYDKDKTYQELFTSNLFLDKLTNLNGNIDLSLDTLLYLKQLLNWYDNTRDIEDLLDEAIEEQKKLSKKIERIIPKPTLYL